MTNHEPPSGYNLPPGCFEHDIDAYFGEGKHTCAECRYMTEFCCDYGICDLEYQEAFDNEFDGFKANIKSTLSDVADWGAVVDTRPHARYAGYRLRELQKIERNPTNEYHQAKGRVRRGSYCISRCDHDCLRSSWLLLMQPLGQEHE